MSWARDKRTSENQNRWVQFPWNLANVLPLTHQQSAAWCCVAVFLLYGEKNLWDVCVLPKRRIFLYVGNHNNPTTTMYWQFRNTYIKNLRRLMLHSGFVACIPICYMLLTFWRSFWTVFWLLETLKCFGILPWGFITGLFLLLFIDFKTRVSSFSPLSYLLGPAVPPILLKRAFVHIPNLSVFKSC